MQVELMYDAADTHLVKLLYMTVDSDLDCTNTEAIMSIRRIRRQLTGSSRRWKRRITDYVHVWLLWHHRMRSDRLMAERSTGDFD
jgi:hypothetical protein